MIRRYIWLVLLLLCNMVSIAAVNAVRVSAQEQQPVILLLEHRPLMTFHEDEMQLSTDLVQVRFALESHPVVQFIDTEADALEEMEANVPKIEIDHQRLSAAGLRPGALLRLYALDGKLLRQTQADSQGRATLELSGAQIFILRSEGFTFKIQTSYK